MMTGCLSGKIPYETRADAKAKVREIKRQGRTPGTQRAYWCVCCDQWHLTSLSRAENNLRRRHYAAKAA